MQTGGQYNTPQAARIIRYAGLVAPIILTGYGLLYSFEILSSPSYTGITVLLSIVSFWLLVGIWQFVVPAKTAILAATRLTLYHIASVAYLLLVTGIGSPFVVAWLVLLIAAYLYFGRKGVLLSIGVFMIAVLLSSALVPLDTATAMYNLGAIIAVLLSGLVVMSVSHVQSVDQTELKRSHEQEILQRDRILTIINNLTDAVLSTDNANIIRVYNAASLDLLDTNDSLNGHHIDTALTFSDQNGAQVLASSLLKKAPSVQVREDLWYEFEDGERIRLEVTISPIRKTFRHNSSVARDGFIIIMRDITKTKSLEEERDEFISVVSHELRTPITVVEGSLSNLEVMLKQPRINKERLAESVKMSHDQTMYLAKMINDLSALSRAERGVSDSTEIVDVKELMQQLFRNYTASAQEKGLSLDIDMSSELGSVEVSRLYLEELLQNFISNAIKYTKEGSITIKAHQKHGVITFAVKDTGIGVSKTDQAKLFDKFYRSEDYRTRETGGTGLGLYVSSKLARKLGTTIQLSSRINHGSTFYFELPVYTPPKN